MNHQLPVRILEAEAGVSAFKNNSLNLTKILEIRREQRH